MSQISNKDWKTYETKIDNLVLEYSFPIGQSKSIPKKDSPLKIINTSDINKMEEHYTVKIYDGFWDVGGSRFKQVDGFFKSLIYLEKTLSNFNKNISDYDNLKDSIIHSAYEYWKISNEAWLKKADYLTPLKYNEPSSFEKIVINGNTWLNYDSSYYSFPINSKFYITLYVDTSYAYTEKDHIIKVKKVVDRIVNSLKIKKINQK